jgi:O-Antigen ligase
LAAAAAAASGRQKLALREAAVALAVACAVAAAAQAEGAYFVSGWGLLGLGLVAAAVLQLAAGRRPARRVVQAAAALLTLAVWSAVSAVRGGVTGEALANGDRLLIAAAALLVGSMLVTGNGRGRAVAVGITAAATTIAAEVLAVLPFDPQHGGWLLDGILVGPVGYKNAQGALFATSIPLAVLLVQSAHRAARAAAAAAAVLLLAALFLTQSRGALSALAVALIVQMLVDRRPGVLRAVVGLYVAGAVLFGSLAHVNASLTSRPAHGLTFYALVALGLAVLAAAATAAARESPRRRRWSKAVAVVLVLFVAGSVTALAVLSLDLATSRGAPAPRITDLTLRGRADAWSAAWRLSKQNLVLGNGVGSFARQWPLLGPPHAPHILQPHSVELEQLAELGVVGLVLFLGSWALLFRCPDRADRPLAVAAACGGAILLAQASADWTWSFPGIVVPVFLVLGAAAGGRRGLARPRYAVEAVAASVAVAALVVIAAPFLSDRALASAMRERLSNPAQALAGARSAARLNPWDSRTRALEGSILESTGDYAAAAVDYGAAATDALEPWVDHLNEARAASEAKDKASARRACEAALRENPYTVDAVLALCPRADGRPWPLVPDPRGDLAPPFSRLLVSQGCSGCGVTVSGGVVSAKIPGSFPFEDTAVAVANVAGTKGGQDVLRVALRLSLRRTPSAPLVFLQVRDARKRLIYALFVTGPSRSLSVYNPPGGFHAVSFVAPLEGRAPLWPRAARIVVTLRRDSYAEFRVNGHLGYRMPSPGHATPSGALTGVASYVEAGIAGYDTSKLDDPIELAISGLAARASPAP